jgi:hypothetical protein
LSGAKGGERGGSVCADCNLQPSFGASEGVRAKIDSRGKQASRDSNIYIGHWSGNHIASHRGIIGGEDKIKSAVGGSAVAI